MSTQTVTRSILSLIVEACMLTGATPKDEVRSVMQRLTSRSKNRPPGEETQKEIKLVYVTVGGTNSSDSF